MNPPFFSIGIALVAAAGLLSIHMLLPQSLLAGQASPQERVTVMSNEAGARTFSTNCSGCHGADGRGGERAPNIASARNIVILSDEELVSIVNKGVPGSGMPAFAYLGAPTVKDVVVHLRVLQGKTSVMTISGDPSAGRAMFFGRAGCSQCHMVKGEGGFIASDLTDYADGIAQDSIQLAITKPDAGLASTSTVVELMLQNGEHIVGVARAEDNFDLTVQTKEGQWRTFDKSKVKDVKHTGRSLHPRDYDTQLSPKELEDIVGYLQLAAANAPSKPARRRNR